MVGLERPKRDRPPLGKDPWPTGTYTPSKEAVSELADELSLTPLKTLREYEKIVKKLRVEMRKLSSIDKKPVKPGQPVEGKRFVKKTPRELRDLGSDPTSPYALKNYLASDAYASWIDQILAATKRYAGSFDEWWEKRYGMKFSEKIGIPLR